MEIVGREWLATTPTLCFLVSSVLAQGPDQAAPSPRISGAQVLRNLQIAAGNTPVQREDMRRRYRDELKIFGELHGLSAQQLRKTENEFDRQFSLSLPTTFDDPSLYATLSMHAEEIELAAAQMNMKIPVRPLLGTLAKGPINAMAIQACPTDDYIIAFQQAIFWFTLMTSSALTPILPKVKDVY